MSLEAQVISQPATDTPEAKLAVDSTTVREETHEDKAEASNTPASHSEHKLEDTKTEDIAEAAGRPDDTAIAVKLREILADESLSMNVTERQLRTRLEDHFGTPLKDRKAVIRQEVMDWLAKRQESQKSEDPTVEDRQEDELADQKPKRKRGNNKTNLLSEPLQKFLGVERMSRFAVTKEVWKYIKEHNLQKPEDRRCIIVDEKLGTIFTSPLNMLSIAKQLSRHIYTAEEADGDYEDAPPPKKRSQSNGGDDEDFAPTRRKPSSSSKKSKKEGSARKSPFTREYNLSEEMQQWLGQKTAARPFLTKKFFEYIKQNELQDPEDKRYTLCDEPLQKITGKDRILSFGALKYFNKHILEPSDEPQGATKAVAAADADNDDDDAELSD